MNPDVPGNQRYEWSAVMGDPALRHRLATVLARGLGEEVAWAALHEFTADQDDDVALTLGGWQRRLHAWARHLTAE